jgi:hypothetical protein
MEDTKRQRMFLLLKGRKKNEIEKKQNESREDEG